MGREAADSVFLEPEPEGRPQLRAIPARQQRARREVPGRGAASARVPAARGQGHPLPGGTGVCLAAWMRGRGGGSSRDSRSDFNRAVTPKFEVPCEVGVAPDLAKLRRPRQFLSVCFEKSWGEPTSGVTQGHVAGACGSWGAEWGPLPPPRVSLPSLDAGWPVAIRL